MEEICLRFPVGRRTSLYFVKREWVDELLG